MSKAEIFAVGGGRSFNSSFDVGSPEVESKAPRKKSRSRRFSARDQFLRVRKDNKSKGKINLTAAYPLGKGSEGFGAISALGRVNRDGLDGKTLLGVEAAWLGRGVIPEYNGNKVQSRGGALALKFQGQITKNLSAGASFGYAVDAGSKVLTEGAQTFNAGGSLFNSFEVGYVVHRWDNGLELGLTGGVRVHDVDHISQHTAHTHHGEVSPYLGFWLTKELGVGANWLDDAEDDKASDWKFKLETGVATGLRKGSFGEKVLALASFDDDNVLLGVSLARQDAGAQPNNGNLNRFDQVGAHIEARLFERVWLVGEAGAVWTTRSTSPNGDEAASRPGAYASFGVKGKLFETKCFGRDLGVFGTVLHTSYAYEQTTKKLSEMGVLGGYDATTFQLSVRF